MYKLPCKETTEKYFHWIKFCKRNFCKSKYSRNVLDIFSQIDESKKIDKLSRMLKISPF